MKWVLLTTAPNQITAESWCAVLRDAGISAEVRSGDVSTFMGVSALPCGVMVPEEQRSRAEAILMETLNEES